MPLDDEILRLFGFKIHCRPEVGEALWCSAGQVYTYDEALGMCMVMLNTRIFERRGEL